MQNLDLGDKNTNCPLQNFGFENVKKKSKFSGVKITIFSQILIDQQKDIVYDSVVACKK